MIRWVNVPPQSANELHRSWPTLGIEVYWRESRYPALWIGIDKGKIVPVTFRRVDNAALMGKAGLIDWARSPSTPNSPVRAFEIFVQLRNGDVSVSVRHVNRIILIKHESAIVIACIDSRSQIPRPCSIRCCVDVGLIEIYTTNPVKETSTLTVPHRRRPDATYSKSPDCNTGAPGEHRYLPGPAIAQDWYKSHCTGVNCREHPDLNSGSSLEETIKHIQALGPLLLFCVLVEHASLIGELQSYRWIILAAKKLAFMVYTLWVGIQGELALSPRNAEVATALQCLA
ncbi:hypothetical protein KC351_g123 [Hortaea werneckii]|nr:hypothetical protein KC351_g123 [Hortaea werneckii]